MLNNYLLGDDDNQPDDDLAEDQANLEEDQDSEIPAEGTEEDIAEDLDDIEGEENE